jgi:hypothetical protein
MNGCTPVAGNVNEVSALRKRPKYCIGKHFVVFGK